MAHGLLSSRGGASRVHGFSSLWHVVSPVVVCVLSSCGARA